MKNTFFQNCICLMHIIFGRKKVSLSISGANLNNGKCWMYRVPSSGHSEEVKHCITSPNLRWSTQEITPIWPGSIQPNAYLNNHVVSINYHFTPTLGPRILLYNLGFCILQTLWHVTEGPGNPLPRLCYLLSHSCHKHLNTQIIISLFIVFVWII